MTQKLELEERKQMMREHQINHKHKQPQQVQQHLKLLQQTHPQLLEVHQQLKDQMFNQLQYNQLQAIPIFIQQTH